MLATATDPIREPRDPTEDDIAEALADPEFLAGLQEDEAAEARGEPVPTYSDEEVRRWLEEGRRGGVLPAEPGDDGVEHGERT